MDNVGRRVDGLGWEKGGWKRLGGGLDG